MRASFKSSRQGGPAKSTAKKIAVGSEVRPDSSFGEFAPLNCWAGTATSKKVMSSPALSAE